LVTNLELGLEAAQVPIVSDTTTIVNATNDVVHSSPWDFSLRLQEVLKHSLGGFQVRVVELVHHIEPKRAELPSLLHDGVEEG
jgi:hypothetical protein